MTDEQKQIYHITDMLNGEINRMCVTDDIGELQSMYGFAKKNLEQLWGMMYQKLKTREANK